MKKIICLLCAVIMITLNCNLLVSAEELSINAKASILMEMSTGKVLYENNADEKLPIASVTKIMTMLLIMEAVDSGKIALDDMVTVSERAMSMGGSTMFLETGEQFTVSDMLKGIAVASANDGAVAMAEFIAGSESGFVAMMNEKAKELGMENSSFMNTNGLDTDGHYSSARDVAIMSRELLKHEKIFEYTTIWMDSLRDGKTQLANTNKLVRFYKGANGLKTGSTSKALCCLSAAAKRDNMQLIAVVLGAPSSKDRFAGASTLLDYGFANYAVKQAVVQEEVLGDVSVSKGDRASINAVAKNEFAFLVDKGSNKEVERNVQFQENLTAPVEKGEVIGKLELLSDNEVIGSIDIVAGEGAAKKSFAAMLGDVFKCWLNKQ